MRRVGVLMPSAMADSEAKARVAAFLQGLRELGWTDGSNVRIEYRWGSGDAGRVPKYAEELVALAPDVILGQGSSTAGPLLQATRAIPIVFVIVPDPVSAGFVDSLARPGGNATGFLMFEYGHQREMAGTPQANRARFDAGGSPSGSSPHRFSRTVSRHPVRCAVIPCRADRSQCAGCRRD